MRPDDREWLRNYINARLERHRVKEEMTRDMLQRSQEAIARSAELLKLPLPIMWHPKPRRGTTAMDYRAYILDDEGRITGVHELECANDEEAKEKAAQLLDGHDLEVWHRERSVARLKHHTRQ